MERDHVTFGPDTTAAEVLAGVVLQDKRALITGGSGGLGAATARALAARGAEVIITARNPSQAEDLVRSTRESTGAELIVEQLELGSLASVRALAARLLATPDTLDILIGNAGVMACPQNQTSEGFELRAIRRRRAKH